MPGPFHDPATGTIRRKGLAKAIGGFGLICLLWPLGLMGLLERLRPSSSPGFALMLAVAAPYVLFCIGMLEVVTGRRVRHISSAWQQMSEWKQGLLFLLLVSLAIGLVALILWAKWPASSEP